MALYAVSTSEKALLTIVKLTYPYFAILSDSRISTVRVTDALEDADFTPVSLTIGRRIPFKLVGRRSQLELSMKELRREKGAGGSFERAPKRAVDPENSTSSSEPKSHILWLPHCDPVQ